MGTSSYNWALFWLIAGFMAGIGVSFLLIPLWQHRITKRKWLLFAVPLLFISIAVAVYALRGQPQSFTTTNASVWPDSHALQQSLTGSAVPGSLEEVTAKLAARLATGQGTDADWQLLQQSYESIGDSEAAALAKQHQVKAGLAAATEGSSVTRQDDNQPAANDLAGKLAPYEARIAKNSKDAEAWLAIAELQRAGRNFAEANKAYEHIITLKAMSASAWADYADVQASLSGNLTNANTRHAVDAALKLEPRHEKALWLKASIAHEEHRYADALAVWQQLLAILPDNSPDRKIIQANADEAGALTGRENSPTRAASNSQTATAARISGRVELDSALKDKIGNNMTLFVFAKPDDAMGMPAAVLRMQVKTWPVEFVLDDSEAMLPTRKLSQFKTVVVQARLSQSGQATAQAGDLQTDAVTIATRAAQPLVLHLAQLVK